MFEDARKTLFNLVKKSEEKKMIMKTDCAVREKV